MLSMIYTVSIELFICLRVSFIPKLITIVNNPTFMYKVKRIKRLLSFIIIVLDSFNLKTDT